MFATQLTRRLVEGVRHGGFAGALPDGNIEQYGDGPPQVTVHLRHGGLLDRLGEDPMMSICHRHPGAGLLAPYGHHPISPRRAGGGRVRPVFHCEAAGNIRGRPTSIVYVSPHFYTVPMMTFDFAATCGSCLFSSHRIINIGILAFVFATAAYWLYTLSFVSVWCFFAAVLSLIVYLYFYRSDSSRADRRLGLPSVDHER